MIRAYEVWTWRRDADPIQYGYEDITNSKKVGHGDTAT